MSRPLRLLTIALTALWWFEARAEQPSMEWDASSRRLLVPGGLYGRIKRLSDGSWLACAERGGKALALRSTDRGNTWSTPVIVGEHAHATAANPELCPLRDGSVHLYWNERPRNGGGVHRFAIRMSTSRDQGLSWVARREPVFIAGNTPSTGCWEPAAVEAPDGTIRLFFARERPGEQEIAEITSRDGGKTWSAPKQASLRPGRRDGMPVPCYLADGRLALAIEDNGLVASPGRHPPFRPTIVLPDHKQRWGALAADPLPRFNLAAPYLARFPGGETLLAVQSNEDDARRHRLAVYLGDAQARHFGRRSLPFGLPPGSDCLWNSLFVADRRTVIALSSATIDGQPGLWMVRGRLQADAPGS